MEVTNRDEVIFNQAQYQQRRLDKLFERIDFLNINPTINHPIYGEYNYKIIFNDLISVFSTISAKCVKEEKDGIKLLRDRIEELLATKPPHKLISNMRGKQVMSRLCYPAWSLLSKELRNLRDELELLMDVHGFGNPSKQDKGKAIADM